MVAAIFKPIARIAPMNPISLDMLLIERAHRLREQTEQIRCAQVSWTDAIFYNSADYSALASSASEATILGGVNDQPAVRALYFYSGSGGRGRKLLIRASGVFSTTGTPNIIFQVRMGTVSGSASLAGTSIGVSQAITCGNGVTNKRWDLELILTCFTPGIGTGNTTLSGAGQVVSNGFAAPYWYPLEPTTPDTGTWTSTIDCALQQYINLSATWSASSSSNTITCKSLEVIGYN